MRQYLIKDRSICKNFSKRQNCGVDYIVVHDTGNWDKGASLDRHHSFFKNISDNASYHHLVGNEGNEYKIYNFISEEYKAWHCGDGKGKYGISNENSIGIGICVNSDSDYKNNILGLARLAAELLIKHDLTIDRLVRHYDASKKICPELMSFNDWKLWKGFYDLTNTIVNWLQSGANLKDINNAILSEYEKFQNEYEEEIEFIKAKIEERTNVEEVEGELEEVLKSDDETK